ncbi:MAG: hypothetical protein CMN30_17095 [Sandaracinus sp.]|nr:hypothetical protein [Sandaracinus sp.]
MNQHINDVRETASPDAQTLRGTLAVLRAIEDQCARGPALLRFEGAGDVLVTHGALCWASARGMRQRMSDLLRYKCNPPLEREFLTEVLQRCRRERTPLGDALLATGKVTESGLRSALANQVTDAIARIGMKESQLTARENLARAEYDERFTFSPAEIFAALGARRDPAGAVVARRRLQWAFDGTGGCGFAFFAEGSRDHTVALAVTRECSLAIQQMVVLARWAREILRVEGFLEPSRLVVAKVDDWTALVAWSREGVIFAGRVPLDSVEHLASTVDGEPRRQTQ